MTKVNKLIDKYKLFPIQVRASFCFLICSFLQRGISVITTPIFTRLLSTTEYGKFSVFNSWYGIVSIIITLALYSGVHTQGLVKFNDKRAVFSSSLQGLVFTLVMFWTVIYLLFRDFWNKRVGLTTVQMLAMLVMVWTTAVFNFWANEQKVSYKYRALVLITLIVSIAKPLLGIFLVTHSADKVTARILGLMLVELICFSWMYILQLKRGKCFFSKRFWKYALMFNLPLVPHYLSQTVLNSVDRIMIKNLVGESEAGIYSLAYSLSSIMTLFNTALSQTISPWIYQKIKDKKGRDIAPVAYITLSLIAAVNLLLILLAPEAVAIFAPASYYDAIWVIPPVALSAYFMYSYDLYAKFAFYYEKTKFVMIASVLAAAFNLVLNDIFIKKLGYLAAGYTTLICFIVYAVGHYIFMKKVCKQFCDSEYPYESKKILLITIPFMMTGLTFLATYNYPAIRYSIIVFAGIIAIIMRRRIIDSLKKIINLKKQ